MMMMMIIVHHINGYNIEMEDEYQLNQSTVVGQGMTKSLNSDCLKIMQAPTSM